MGIDILGKEVGDFTTNYAFSIGISPLDVLKHIISPLASRLSRELPENPLNHLEQIEKHTKQTIADYINRWQMYNKLFANS